MTEYPWTGAEIAARVGCSGTYTPKPGAFPVAIEVRSCRYVYGRNELLVSDGKVKKWVRHTSVKLKPKKEGHREGAD